ncbi:Fungal Zn(2)-Cys(6) binuclear cluster domain [Geosmithia morbida]|uniref:Fungal Zn(2)-Cys(6) binuclear cluster domain n=1 Tax=Geosmithia morbida TaxID=1094350 RepID=A0A9P4YN00_9HYPO|nr:Fungal Zn(2)-Cys(6) binuclear cluster domain [Geosmithia morbida]KAF4119948.1 Fungal Zn(2)-Cys(6) binuclear cluster domain [Geosmithia morbida]
MPCLDYEEEKDWLANLTTVESGIWRGYCDGYTQPDNTPRSSGASPSSKLIHTKKAPLVLNEPSINTIRFKNGEQRAYFDEWTSLSVYFLSGGLSQTSLWTTTLPQLSLEEPTLRTAAMAIGALRKAYSYEGLPIGSVLSDDNRHYINAITYYCKALRLQTKAMPTNEGMRTALLSSLLFICFEAQRSNIPAALKHVTHGFTMLNELATCTENGPSLVSIAPAPPSLVQEILECYKPLEQQSRSFTGSYRKVFFFSETGAPNQPNQPFYTNSTMYTANNSTTLAGQMFNDTPPGGGSNPTGLGLNESSAGSSPQTSSPPSLPGTPWSMNEAVTVLGQGQRNSHEGFPSPQSQTGPKSKSSQTPFRLQRPTRILPFSKHCPYFRPKHSNITSLGTLPITFSSIEEAWSYWGLLQKHLMQHQPLFIAATSQIDLAQVTDDADLERRFARAREMPEFSELITETRYWLQRWCEAFDPLYENKLRERDQDRQGYLEAASLRIEYLVAFIYGKLTRYSKLEIAMALTPQYRELNMLSETLLQARPSCGFSMDRGWTWPLYVTTYNCRDPAVRADAIRILEQYPICNALRDSRVIRAIALRNDEAERESAEGADGDEAHWLRMRRREIVFDDLGRSVIFRSVRRDHTDNRWVLIEEAADFTIQKDGLLPWKQQPISEAKSILYY